MKWIVKIEFVARPRTAPVNSEPGTGNERSQSLSFSS
jgi:hypothetical protein